MLLFLTRDAFCRRSMEERRTGEGDPVRLSRLFSELKRVCQNTRGEVALSTGDMGDDWKGEESVFRGDILDFACAWLEPGEFLLCSVGEISDSGRGIALCVLDGIGIVLPLERRRGCTGSSDAMVVVMDGWAWLDEAGRREE